VLPPPRELPPKACIEDGAPKAPLPPNAGVVAPPPKAILEVAPLNAGVGVAPNGLGGADAAPPKALMVWEAPNKPPPPTD